MAKVQICKLWDEITYPLPNLNDAAVEDREWTSNYMLHFTGHVITYPFWEYGSSVVAKGTLVTPVMFQRFLFQITAWHLFGAKPSNVSTPIYHHATWAIVRIWNLKKNRQIHSWKKNCLQNLSLMPISR